MVDGILGIIIIYGLCVLISIIALESLFLWIVQESYIGYFIKCYREIFSMNVKLKNKEDWEPPFKDKPVLVTTGHKGAGKTILIAERIIEEYDGDDLNENNIRV